MPGGSDAQGGSLRRRAGAVLPVLILAFLACAQGGFFGLAPCISGTLLCLAAIFLWLRKSHRSQGISPTAALFCAVALAYALSAAANGLTLTTLSSCGVWAGCAGMALVASAQDEPTRNLSLRLLCWLIAAMSVLGMLVYVEAVTLVEGMVEDRLQLTFQYANAAGAWFAVGTLLCALSPDRKLRRLAAFPATALLLTQSAGALFVFALVAAIAGVRWARCATWDRLAEALIAGAIAALGFVLLHVARTPLAAACLTALLAAYTLSGETLQDRCAKLGSRRVSLLLVAAMVVSAAVGLLVFRTRVGQASSSMAERAHHVHDGLTLWLTHPLLGVGPNNWQFLYRPVQTARYNTTVVHSSLVQGLLDAGLIGLCLLAAAAATGLRTLALHASHAVTDDARDWSAACLEAAAFLLLHAAIEFVLQFASLSYLLALLLSEGGNDRRAATQPQPHALVPQTMRGLGASLACLCICLPLCAIGTMSELTVYAQRMALSSGDYVACERLCTASAFSRSDVLARERLMTAQYARGDFTAVVASYQATPTPSDASTLQAADACYRTGDHAQAGLILVERMEQQPYNVAFSEEAATIASAWDLDESLAARYRAAVDYANTLAKHVGPLLPQQQPPAGT